MPYPWHISHPKVQISITIISQVLGLESDQSIDELTLGFLVTVCIPEESCHVSKYNFVE